MNRVQELIDENKEQMPTALAKVLLDACKEEADNTKQLYKLTWTMVDSHAHVVEVEDAPNHPEVKLSHKTQTLIVEAVDERPDNPNGHGGKISSPADTQKVYQETNCVGFVGASSIERIPVEQAVKKIAEDFKAIPFQKKKN